MNLEKLGQWMGVIANVGVFAGFLLVAYQLHQNTISLQSTSAYASNQLFASSDMSMMGDTTYAAFAHSLTDPAGLSPEEMAQMWASSSVTMFSANRFRRTPPSTGSVRCSRRFETCPDEHAHVFDGTPRRRTR